MNQNKMIDENVPEPRKLKASWTVETAQDLRWIYAMKPPSFWEWRFLWNWKAAYKKYQRWKLEQELVNCMAEEIRKECDEAILQVIKEEAEKIKIDK